VKPPSGIVAESGAGGVLKQWPPDGIVTREFGAVSGGAAGDVPITFSQSVW